MDEGTAFKDGIRNKDRATTDLAITVLQGLVLGPPPSTGPAVNAETNLGRAVWVETDQRHVNPI